MAIGRNAWVGGSASRVSRPMIVATGLLTILLTALPAQSAQQVPQATLPDAVPTAMVPAPTTSPSVAAPSAQAESAPSATLPTGGAMVTPVVAAPATAQPEQPNPFSNVRPTTDSQVLKQEIPTLEQRLREVENRVSAIQQVQVAVPADALNEGPVGRSAGAAGASGMLSEQQVEMQTATFIACVNGKAMFRDSDQKPFFVDAKQASENDAVRRIGGCKH